MIKRSQKLAERDRIIVQTVRDKGQGATLRVLGHKFGIKPQRVREIYHRDRHRERHQIEENLQVIAKQLRSPPYWGLRDYGTASWEGGDAGCEHNTLSGRGQRVGIPDLNASTLALPDVCFHCGARRIDSQIAETKSELLTKIVKTLEIKSSEVGALVELDNPETA